MNSTKFYKEEDTKIIKNKRKFQIMLLVFLLCVFICVITLLFVYSSYDTRKYYIIGGSIFSIIITFIGTYISYKIADLNHVLKHFFSINYHQENIVEATFISKSEKPITIDRYTRVYPLEIEIEKDIKTIFINALFNFDFVEGKKYKIILASEYVKGVEDEL